jgi:NAD(P)H-dependent flavin oxidoreductase YrpB (nitropropane dioxygenase family)
MQQMPLVGVVECVSDGRHDVECILERHPARVAIAHQVGGVGAVDVVHGDPQLAVNLATVVHADNVGMPQCRGQVGLALESGTVIGIRRDYAKALAPEAQGYGVRLGAPRDDDDGWAAKLLVVSDMRPAVVSFTFGLPSEQICARLQGRGILLFASVTSVAEAKMAVACGIDALIVQGPAAGGHRATFDPAAPPCDTPLLQLLTAICLDADVPVVASGGLATGRVAQSSSSLRARRSR